MFHRGFIFKYALWDFVLSIIWWKRPDWETVNFALAFMTAILSLISLVYKAIIPGGILFYDYMLTALRLL